MALDTLDISEARSKITTLPARLRKQNVIWITRHNKPAFAAVDLELMETLLETLEILKDKNALRMLQDSLNDIRNGDLIDQDDLEQELGSWEEKPV